MKFLACCEEKLKENGIKIQGCADGDLICLFKLDCYKKTNINKLIVLFISIGISLLLYGFSKY